jgi:hypothetical protein
MLLLPAAVAAHALFWGLEPGAAHAEETLSGGAMVLFKQLLVSGRPPRPSRPNRRRRSGCLEWAMPMLPGRAAPPPLPARPRRPPVAHPRRRPPHPGNAPRPAPRPQDQIQALGPWGAAAFVVTVMFAEMVPLLPTQPLSLASGLMFGAKEVRAPPAEAGMPRDPAGSGARDRGCVASSRAARRRLQHPATCSHPQRRAPFPGCRARSSCS